MSTCTVKWCGKNTRTSSFKKDGITFHRFPKDPNRKAIWIEACRRDKKWYPPCKALMCSRHFEKMYFSIKNRIRLMNDAVPTLYLPVLTNIPSAPDDNYENYENSNGEESSSEMTVSEVKPQRVVESEQSSDNDFENGHEDIVIKEEPVSDGIHRRMKPHSKPRLTKPIRRRVIEKVSSSASKLDSRLLETLRLLRRSDLSRKKDECDSFGEYIADSLRKHDDKTQSMIKQAINNILFEQEMKKYNTHQYTVVINECLDENPLHLDHGDK